MLCSDVAKTKNKKSCNHKYHRFIVVQSTPALTSTTQDATSDFYYILFQNTIELFCRLITQAFGFTLGSPRTLWFFEDPPTNSWFYIGITKNLVVFRRPNNQLLALHQDHPESCGFLNTHQPTKRLKIKQLRWPTAMSDCCRFQCWRSLPLYALMSLEGLLDLYKGCFE